ncbi:MAG: nucleoside monophosphate kinase [Patescibacteria group bacterium]
MKGVNFPVFKTKTEGVTQKFNLNDPEDRKKYFAAKAGTDIEKLKKYLETKTFVGFLMGKKNSGKGTYSKLFMEAVGKEHVGHVSIGDIVRDIHKSLSSEDDKKTLLEFMEKNFRGFHSVEELEDLILGRGTSSLMSSELIVALIKYEISRRPKKAIFIDGFPRAMDQIGYSLFLKELIGYRDDPDFMVFIDVPERVIDERIKSRVICPKCNTPRSLKLALTKEVGYDETQKSFYLICDDCHERMVPKEGDELGIEPIRSRLEVDDQISKQLLELSGIPKLYLRNSVPIDQKDIVDDYELTPMYEYVYNNETKKVDAIEKPWVVKDDNGVDSYSLMPSAVALGLISQIAKTLNL